MGAQPGPLALAALSPAQRRVLALVLLSGGTAVLTKLRAQLRDARREQQELSKGVEPRRGPRQAAVAVDALFARRLKAILKICVPSPFCAEAGLICGQSALLILRSLLTEYISRLEGRAGRWIIAQNAPQLTRTLLQFVAVCLPAAITNSGLKYLQRRIKISFQRRLTLRLHEHLCQHRAYYLASTLGGLTMVDQRITEDVERFAHTISELYPYTFKPLLDVVLFTRSLSRMMGYRRQFALYGYYMLAAQVLRAASPPLALMTAQEAALGGAFRGAHQRLVQHAEEIAFNDPPAGMAERMILDQSLYRLLRHSRLSALLQFVQQSLDGFMIKYGATAVALCIFALPLYRPSTAGRATADYFSGSQGERTGQYLTAMRLLGNTSRAIGDLVLVYKRVTGLAGHTSRVSELLERVSGLASADEEGTMRSLYLRNVSSSGVLLPTSASGGLLAPLPEPRRLEGETIKFERVYLASPDGHELVRELSFQVVPGRSVIIQGPNGSGKSSLFRVAAGLWPLQAGEVVMPPRGELFYLSQRPYLVAGTLRDQLLYPEPPQAVYAAAKSERTRSRIEPWMKSRLLSDDELEERLCECLEAVELDYLLIRGRGWNQVQPWRETLSGGEQQRLAMARLLFHRPKYAILDECTSAVSADGEQRLISEAVRRGITMLSIGHRPALRRFHSTAVHFEGSGQWRLEQLRGSDAEGLAEEPPSHSHQQLDCQPVVSCELATSLGPMAARVFFDIAIGDRTKHEADVAAHERACRFFAAVSSQYGWSGDGPQDLDADAQEVFQEAYASDPSWAAQGPALLAPPQLAGGRLIIELSAAKEAPKACENFRCLCTGEKGVGKASGKPLHYKGVRLHRVQKGFVAQGGDVVKGDGSGGDSIYGGKFKDEPAALKLKHDAAGVVGMANSGKNSNTSQFYVTLAPAPQCDGKHVVVGRVVEGLEVLQQLEELAASADGTPRVDVVVADCGSVP